MFKGVLLSVLLLSSFQAFGDTVPQELGKTAVEDTYNSFQVVRGAINDVRKEYPTASAFIVSGGTVYIVGNLTDWLAHGFVNAVVKLSGARFAPVGSWVSWAMAPIYWGADLAQLAGGLAFVVGVGYLALSELKQWVYPPAAHASEIPAEYLHFGKMNREDLYFSNHVPELFRLSDADALRIIKLDHQNSGALSGKINALVTAN